eukprot:TRINITY_DN6544_c0_g1_i4.p1 TRINITY_DN6544_c0_g1~~TRINITY_DN6544_c0_g1_i4.p1  ORF type:complete len:257 (+),score=23.72 TRINITY_DN6544_c0_g1_i4:395-1165(+)
MANRHRIFDRDLERPLNNRPSYAPDQAPAPRPADDLDRLAPGPRNLGWDGLLSRIRQLEKELERAHDDLDRARDKIDDLKRENEELRRYRPEPPPRYVPVVTPVAPFSPMREVIPMIPPGSAIGHPIQVLSSPPPLPPPFASSVYGVPMSAPPKHYPIYEMTPQTAHSSTVPRERRSPHTRSPRDRRRSPSESDRYSPNRPRDRKRSPRRPVVRKEDPVSINLDRGNPDRHHPRDHRDDPRPERGTMYYSALHPPY